MRREINSFSDEQLTQLLHVNGAFEFGIRRSPGSVRKGSLSPSALRAWLNSRNRSDDTLITTVMTFAASCTEGDADPKQVILPMGEDLEAWLLTVARGQGQAAALVCLMAALEDGDLDESEVARLRSLIVGTEIQVTPEGDRFAPPDARSPADAPLKVEALEDSGSRLDVSAITRAPVTGAHDPAGRALVTADAVEERLATVVETAVALASALDEAAEALRSSGWPPTSTEEQLSDYRAMAAELRQTLEGLVGKDPGPVDLPNYRRLAALWTEREEQRAQRAEQEAEIKQHIANLTELRDSASDGLRSVYEAPLAKLNKELEDIFASEPRQSDESRRVRTPAQGDSEEAGPATPVGEGTFAATPASDGPTTAAERESVASPAGTVTHSATTADDEDSSDSAAVTATESASPGSEPAPSDHQVTQPVGGSPTGPWATTEAAPTGLADAVKPSSDGKSDAPDEVMDDRLESQLASLVRDGRPAAAALVAMAGGRFPRTSEALRFYAAAFASRDPGGLSPDEALLVAGDVPVPRLPEEHLAAVACVAAAARAGLAAGWAYPKMHGVLLRELTLDDPWNDLLEATAEAAQHGYTHRGGATPSTGPSRRDFAELAERTLGQLKSRTITYQRGTKVLLWLLRSDQAVGEALAALSEWARGNDDAIRLVRDASRQLQDRRGRDRLIEQADVAVSSTRQRKTPITASALKQLHTHLSEVHELFASALRSPRGSRTEVSPDEDMREQLISLANAIASPCSGGDLEAALLDNLRLWILNPDSTWTEAAGDLDDLMWRASIPLTQAPRDQQGQIDLRGISVEYAAGALLSPISVDDSVRQYLERGDLATAAAIAEADERLLDDVAAAEEAVRKMLRARVLDLEQSLARAQAEELLGDEEISLLSGLLAGASAYRGDRLDLQHARLDQTQATLDTARHLRSAAFLTEIERLPGTEAERQRISGLVEKGDLATAREYQLMLERGEELPDRDDGSPTLLEQFVALCTGLPQEGALDEIVEFAGGLGEGPRAPRGVEAWKDLHSDNPTTEAWRSLRTVLRLLGLDLADAPSAVDEQGGQRRVGYRTYRVTATPVDGSTVPGLGSRAQGTYRVVHVTERKAPELLMRALDGDDGHGPTILVLKWLLSDRDRRAVLDLARERLAAFLVVDPAVVGFVAARHPGSFRALQSITLPFSAFGHYTPYVAGDVPPEVFVGRLEQKRAITDPDGSLFVYGGRQLGKSALLRRIETEFTHEPDRYAIYLDLKAKGVGTTRPPQYLWSVLSEEFHQRGIIRGGIGRPETIVARVVDWLLENPQRRILLLLDEADAFLESEAREPARGEKSIQFANVGLLKDLMQRTSRRFKPVFAGLHQVQRFHHISNTPLAHGGYDILVGPLSRLEATELVEGPLTALGFTFEDRDLVWRLLAATNYQASLIQIACYHLVEDLRKQRPRPGQPPTVITAAEVDRVLTSREVRQRLLERFRWTIGLEHRYLVIALVLGVLGYDDDFSSGHDPDELLWWCRGYWPVGFGDMTSHDFALYLEEMQGLGVLREHTDGTWSFRSPNVVEMLGSREKLEQELAEGGQRFELPFDFNPRVARRTVKTARALVRSPLSEADLSVVFPAPMDPGVVAVFGSEALGISDAPPVLHTVGGEILRALGSGEDPPVETLSVDSFRSFATDQEAASGTRTHPLRLAIIDATSAARSVAGDLIDLALRYAGRSPRWRGAIVFGVGALSELTRGDRIKTVRLRRWTSDDLRAWGEGAFDDEVSRSHTLAITGGWPRLIERVIDQTSLGRSLADVLDELKDFPSDSRRARQFLEAAIPASLQPALRTWAQLTSPEDEIDIPTLESIMSIEPDAWPEVDVDRLVTALAWLEVTGGSDIQLALNPVVHRALRRLDK
jgi:hypothetical protein